MELRFLESLLKLSYHFWIDLVQNCRGIHSSERVAAINLVSSRSIGFKNPDAVSDLYCWDLLVDLGAKYDPDVLFFDVIQSQVLLNMVDSTVFGICDSTSPFLYHLSCDL